MFFQEASDMKTANPGVGRFFEAKKCKRKKIMKTFTQRLARLIHNEEDTKTELHEKYGPSGGGGTFRSKFEPRRRVLDDK